MTSRQNSLLTDAQREFIRLSEDEREEKYSKQQRSYHRQNIKKRFHAGMSDISLIVGTLNIKELKEVLGNEFTNWRQVVELVVLGTEVGRVSNKLHYPDTPEPEATFDEGIKLAFKKLGLGWRNIEVTIDRAGPLDELAQRDLSELSQEELDQLHEAGKISRSEYARDVLRREEEAHREAMKLGQQAHDGPNNERNER